MSAPRVKPYRKQGPVAEPTQNAILERGFPHTLSLTVHNKGLTAPAVVKKKIAKNVGILLDNTDTKRVVYLHGIAVLKRKRKSRRRSLVQRKNRQALGLSVKSVNNKNRRVNSPLPQLKRKKIRHAILAVPLGENPRRLYANGNIGIKIK
jgi:hypothetical protein